MQLRAQIVDNDPSREAKILLYTQVVRESSVTLEGWLDRAQESTALCPPSLCGPWGHQGEAHLTLAS